MKQIWMAYCGEYDVTQERDREAAREVAEKRRDSVRGGIEPLLAEYGSLMKQAEQLKTGDTQSQAVKILESIKTEAERLERLKEKGAWRGANNPLVQYAMEYGKQRHQDMGRSSDFKCDVLDRGFSGAEGRPELRQRQRVHGVRIQAEQ